MSPFANSPRTPHAPSRPVARQQEMTQVPPGSGPGRGPGSAGRHLMAGPTPPPPPPPLPRRAQSDHISQRQYQHQHQLQNDPPPLPHRNISYQSLAPPLPPRAHELPPSLPPRDRSNTFSDIPADDLPPYVDPIEEAMAAANSGDGDGNGDGTGPAADLAPASASATASASASLQQSHGRQQDPPPYHAIDSTPGAPFSLHGNGLRP
ncbi:hypothetical protein LPJ75_002019 [Coemansia sp. RSA 2598]|nr:hypothetical protein LPJ75_002019 [Coemansia sp. RSA 2598]